MVKEIRYLLSVFYSDRMDFIPVIINNKRTHFCYGSNNRLQAANVTFIIAIVA